MDSELMPENFPLRINISYLLDGVVAEYVTKANSAIFVDGGEFEFEPEGIAIPHITMLMGDVGSSSDLDEVIAVVADTANELAPIDFELSDPYFRDGRGRFIFVDTNPQPQFYQQRLLLQNRAGSLLKIDHYGGAENVSHITLGYNDRGTDPALLEQFKVNHLVTGKASLMQVARTGSRGTCIETLQTFSIVA